MKKLILPVLVMLLVSGVIFAKNLDTGYEPEGLDELAKQKGVFKTTLVRPDADFSRYTKLNARKVMLVVRDPGPQSTQKETGSLIGSRTRVAVMPQYEDLAKLKEIINETIVSELNCNAELEMVHASDAETLVLRAAVTDVVFDETSKIKTADGEPAPVLSQGTIVFDLIDGETGVIQARMGERRKCRVPKDTSPDDENGSWSSAAGWAQLAASDLCQELKRVLEEGSGQGSQSS